MNVYKVENGAYKEKHDKPYKVQKKSGKLFKSGNKVNTVKGIIQHPILKDEKAYTFNEDDSFVSVFMCEIVETV